MYVDTITSLCLIVLIDDDERAQTVAGRLREVLSSRDDCSVLIAPIRGMSFLSDPEWQGAADRWWGANVPVNVTPVYLLEHHDGLAEWLRGIDGLLYVAVESRESADSYTDIPAVRTILTRDDGQFVAAVLDDLALSADRAPESRSTPQREGMLRAPTDHPFELLARALGSDSLWGEESATTAESAVISPTPARMSDQLSATSTRHRFLPRLRWQRAHRQSPAVADAELARHLLARQSTILAVGSRKGGVGKTSHAAGIAITVGEAVDRVGRQAVIIDANLANPDAWGQLNLASGAATVRDLVTAVNTGSEPPRPVFAATPALACFPEARSASEYSRTEVARVASYLRSRFAFAVIDMTNRLPDPTGGPEAAVAAYWLEHADVLLLPTASSKQEFIGVLDYLDVPNLPPTVVAYLVPRARRNREHPLTKRYLEAIAERSHAIVPVPDEGEQVKYAVMEGRPVQEVSPSLKSAYRRLATTVAFAATPRTA